MAPPHFGLPADARSRAATRARAIPRVRSLINPRQSTPVAYPMPHGDAIVGRPVPDVACGGGHLSERLGRGFVVSLIDVEVSAAERDALASALAPLTIATERLPSWPATWPMDDTHGQGVVLIRPDGYAMARWSHFDADAIRSAIDRLLHPMETVHAD